MVQVFHHWPLSPAAICIWLEKTSRCDVQHSCIAIQAHNLDPSHTSDILRDYVMETNKTEVLCQIYRGREQTVYT